MGQVPCGLTYAQRIGSVQVDRTNFDTVDKRNYYDRVALDEAFGPDRREQMLQETRGQGAVQYAADGSPWVYDDPDTGAMRPMERVDLTHNFLRGESVEEA
jgi:hypothetical protein